MADRLPMTPEEIAKVDELWNAIENDDFFKNMPHGRCKSKTITFDWCEPSNERSNNFFVYNKDNKFIFVGWFFEDIFTDDGELDETQGGGHLLTDEKYDTVKETINRLKQIKTEAEDVAWHGLRAY